MEKEITCPACESTSLFLSEPTWDHSFEGNVIQFTAHCNDCGKKHSVSYALHTDIRVDSWEHDED